MPTHVVADPLQIGVIGSAGPALAPAAIAPLQAPVAVFVAHGMGQQAPFETLDAIASGLIETAGAPVQPVTARTVRIGEQKLQRLEFTLSRNNGDVTVHVYEGYWAPLTEGQTTLRDVTRFLIAAGFNGIRNSVKDFRRWMFGEDLNFGKRFETTIQLIAALGVVASLILMNAVIAVVVATYLLNPGASQPWPGPQLLALFNTIIFPYSVYSAGFIATCLGTVALKGAVKAPRSTWWWRALNGMLMLAFVAWVAATVAAGLAFALAIIGEQLGWIDLLRLELDSKSGHGWLWTWGLLLLVSYWVRDLLVQYMGDVAAYVSPHALDRFNELRQKIKKTVYDAANAVYSADNGHGSYLYDKVVVMGHSLGSVIAYDTLNTLLNEDDLAENRLAVADRTGLFLTFGSPLDKVAFIFARVNATVYQRALAASVQPLIQDYARFRRMRWINLYAPRDIISGKLAFFDNPDISGKGINRIEVEADPDALIPLIAHTEYWKNPTLFTRVLEHLFPPTPAASRPGTPQDPGQPGA